MSYPGHILYEKTGQAPAPSKDFHQLLVSETEVTLRGWKVSVRKDQRLIPPSQRKISWDEFDEDTRMQSEISRIFGEETLSQVHALICGDWLIRLPVDLIMKLCGYLELQDIARLAQVCRKLRDVCCSDKLWENIYRTHCDTVTEKVISLAAEVGWKKLFFTNKLQLQKEMRRRDRQRNNPSNSENLFITE
jgi:F-box protein 36